MDENEKNQTEDSEFDKKYGLYIVLVCLILLAGLFFFDRSSYPELMAQGIKDWATVCKGQERIYRLKSENRFSQQTFSKSVKKRNLQFLDKEGHTLYLTNWFDFDSMDESSVWRFKRTGRGLAGWIHSKKRPKLLQKAGALLFSKESERQKHWDEGKVLYGDEKFFEISLQLDKISIVREKLPTLVLPCKPSPIF